MQLILFDTDSDRKKMQPLSLTRAMADVRLGICTFKERWQQKTGLPVLVYTADYLQPLYPAIQANEAIIIHASILPDDDLIDRILTLEPNHALADSNGLIAGALQWNEFLKLDEQLLQYFETVHDMPQTKRLEYPWQIFQWNAEWLSKDFQMLTKGRKSQPVSTTNQLIHSENIFIEEGVTMEYATINASDGPVYLGKNATIMEGCLIRGGMAVGESSVVKMGSKIYGATTIGPFCTAGGEIKNSMLFGYSNKAHDGYLGDSVIGAWCNIGAGTSNSNVKNTATDVSIWNSFTSENEQAGLKCGVIMGDYTKVAINSSINTGSVYGVCCNVFGEGLLPKLIPDFCWGAKGISRYEFDKAVANIHNWMRMKNKELTATEISILKYIFENHSV